jgi:hypothetical protein
MATQVYESQTGGTGADFNAAYNNNWLCESFVASSTHNVTSIEIDCKKVGDCGNTTMRLYAADADGLPTGSVIVSSGTVASTSIPTHPSQGYVAYTFAAPPTVTRNSRYVYYVECTAANTAPLYQDKNTSTGTGQVGISLNNGSTWATNETKGMDYKVYGDEPITYALTADNATINLVQKTATFPRVFKALLASGTSIVLTTYTILATITRKWTKASKNSSTMANETKSSASWSNESKNSTSFTNTTKT